MHFLFTAPRYHTNQHFAVKALLDAGHQVTFMALGRGQSEVYDALQPTILAQSAPMRVIGMRTPSIFAFWSMMRRLKPDVVIVRDPNSAYGLLSVAVSRLLGRTVIFYTPTPMYRQLDWRRKFIRSFPAWVARAKWMTPILGSPERYTPAFGALRYLPFAMEPQTAPERRQWFQNGVINVLSVGKFEPRKNHRLFLQAVANLSKKYPIRATVIGECTLAEHKHELSAVKELNKLLALGNIVRFESNQSFWEVQVEYAKHDVFVLPSRDEPAGISLLEAMSHSMPVICSDSCGLKGSIRQGENGYVFRTDDANDLERCLERIISDRCRLMEMGATSYEIVVSDNWPAKYAETIVAIADEKEQHL